MYNIIQMLLIIVIKKHNILLNSSGHDPWFLWCVGNGTIYCNIGVACWLRCHLVEDCIEETGFATADLANYHGNFFGGDFYVDLF
jgi:hypothetical protein